MRNLIFVLFAMFLASCASTKGQTGAGGAEHACDGECCKKDGAAAEKPEHTCDGTCDHAKAGGKPCHGDKAGAFHKEGMPEGEHTMENVAAHVDELFGKLDADADGFLTREEVGEHHLAEKFTVADQDADEKISKAEMVSFGKRMHDHMAQKKAAAEAAPTAE
ncbi:MAG: hypothetical protein P1V51_07290 [Deltaproteobacteria bacterium]|nr:hypothetical protein [Deltaproteobacteria bacterium]